MKKFFVQYSRLNGDLVQEGPYANRPTAKRIQKSLPSETNAIIIEIQPPCGAEQNELCKFHSMRTNELCTKDVGHVGVHSYQGQCLTFTENGAQCTEARHHVGFHMFLTVKPRTETADEAYARCTKECEALREELKEQNRKLTNAMAERDRHIEEKEVLQKRLNAVSALLVKRGDEL